jgi:hypothetical protein
MVEMSEATLLDGLKVEVLTEIVPLSCDSKLKKI